MKKILLFVFILIMINDVLIAQETFKKIVNTLKEHISLAGYAQVGYTYNDAANPNNTFDVKRIIFMADGKITQQWSCYFMYDFSSGGTLLEVYTDYQFIPGLSARLGQFKTPYTIENQLSPSSIELINCSSQAVGYLAAFNGSDYLCGAQGGRDIGLMLYGDLLDKLLAYKLAVMNGQGINMKDGNNRKDIIGYLMINPSKWLSVGGSFITGEGHAIAASAITGIPTNENYIRNRWSLGAVLTGKTSGLRTEFLAGKDRTVKSNGFYATGYAQVLPKVDVIASYDYFSNNTAMKYKQSNYIVGVQYWFYPKCRIQAQYTRSVPKDIESSNVIQAQIQVRF